MKARRSVRLEGIVHQDTYQDVWDWGETRCKITWCANPTFQSPHDQSGEVVEKPVDCLACIANERS